MRDKIKPNIWMVAIIGGLFSGVMIAVLAGLLTSVEDEAIKVAIIAGVFTITGGYIAILSSVASALVAPDPSPVVPASSHDKVIEKAFR